MPLLQLFLLLKIYMVGFPFVLAQMEQQHLLVEGTAERKTEGKNPSCWCEDPCLETDLISI